MATHRVITMRLALILLLTLAAAQAEGPGGYGVSVLTEDGCYTETGPGQSAITLGNGWNNGNLDQYVTVYYTSHETPWDTQQTVEQAMALYRQFLPKVSLVKTTNVNAVQTIRIRQEQLNQGVLGIANYPYSVEPVAGDVTLTIAVLGVELAGTKKFLVLMHELGHSLGIPHGGNKLMIPYYQPLTMLFEPVDQNLFSGYYRVNPVLMYIGRGGR